MLRRLGVMVALVASCTFLATLCRVGRLEVHAPAGCSSNSSAETRAQAAPAEALTRERVEPELVPSPLVPPAPVAGHASLVWLDQSIEVPPIVDHKTRIRSAGIELAADRIVLHTGDGVSGRIELQPGAVYEIKPSAR